MPRTIRIGEKLVGERQPLYLCAELGSTTGGRRDTALKLIEAAAQAGFDGVKMFLMNPDALIADPSLPFTYKTAKKDRVTEPLVDVLNRNRLSFEDLAACKVAAAGFGLGWFLTVDYGAGVPVAEQLDCPAYKVSSWDCRNYFLMEALAKTGKPLLIDVGPHVAGEAFNQVEWLKARGCGELLLVHDSHAETPTELNLAAIRWMKRIFGLPVGFSSNRWQIDAELLAIGAGVCFVEKRLTMDRRTPDHHHFDSLAADFSYSKHWVDEMREYAAMMGPEDLVPSRADLKGKELYFTSLVAATFIPAGCLITRSMLAAKRPGWGISPLYAHWFIGKPASRDIQKNEILHYEDVPGGQGVKPRSVAQGKSCGG